LTTPAEKHPGGFESVQDRRQVLAQADPEERVAAVAQRDQQTVAAPALTPVGIEPEPEQAEIDLSRFAGWGSATRTVMLGAPKSRWARAKRCREL
jgi:hypothetical protein